MTLTMKNIDDFFKNKNIAVIGASASKENFGNDVIKELLKKGFGVYPVHPKAKEINSIKCYNQISELPPEVNAIHISTNKKHTNGIISEAKQKGITNIWVQQMSDDRNTRDFGEGINLITGQCFLMHLDPVKGMHKFHRTLKKLFGKLPK